MIKIMILLMCLSCISVMQSVNKNKNKTIPVLDRSTLLDLRDMVLKRDINFQRDKKINDEKNDINRSIAEMVYFKKVRNISMISLVALPILTKIKYFRRNKVFFMVLMGGGIMVAQSALWYWYEKWKNLVYHL